MGVSLLEMENALGAIGLIDRSAPVVLGDLILSGAEVPDELVMGGRQLLVIHRLLGGGRVIDAVGNDPARLVLTGRFLGPLATLRARRVEAMREASRALSFSVADLSARVWIAEFTWSYQAQGTICPYRLVLEREALPPAISLSSGEMAGADLGSGLSTIAGLLGEMSEAGWVGTTMLTSLAGQVMPVAQVLGAGGGVARAQAALGKASALWQTAMSVSRAPTAAVSVTAPLSVAARELGQVTQDAGAAMEAGAVNSAGALSLLSQNAGASVLGVEAGSYANRALRTLAG